MFSDVAVVSNLIAARVGSASIDAAAPLSVYAQSKRNFDNTDIKLKAVGVTFLPIVLEAEGGCGPEASVLLKTLFADVARATGLAQSVVTEQGRQAIALRCLGDRMLLFWNDWAPRYPE